MSVSPPFVALWADDRQRVRVLTRERHLTDLPLPEVPSACHAVEEFLPQLGDCMEPSSQGRSLLMLEPSLPATWFALPWERMSLHGVPLGSQALVVRRASLYDLSARIVGPARYLNLFPANEHPFEVGLESLVSAGILRGANARYLALDGAGSSDLFILAHGDQRGLLDAKRSPFVLPDMHPMPARIWLLACNVGGAMNSLAGELLDRGCRTVIAAVGNISAPQMESVVAGWVARSDLDFDPANWLAARTLEAEDGSTQALSVWGATAVGRGESAVWNLRLWQVRHGKADKLPLDDATDAAAFNAALADMSASDIWQVTREEMAPALLFLAENIHHPSVSELERTVERQIGGQATPWILQALASTARRFGNYPRMARYLLRSLNLKSQSAEATADCLGQLANLFIDIDMPAAALDIVARHQDLDVSDQEASRSADFKRLDWQARAEARRGRFDVALMHLRVKRRRAIHDMEEDGRRELAGLLYLGAWGHLAGAVPSRDIQPLVQEAGQMLELLVPEVISYGNDTAKYLLRSLAAWGWASGDEKLLDNLAFWRDTASARLDEHDPGPWAYVLIFLHLAGKVDKRDAACALESLVRARYMFEAAMFGSWSNNADAGTWLRRFRQGREDILSAMEATDATAFTHLREEAISRSSAEENSLGQIRLAAQQGVMPL